MLLKNCKLNELAEHIGNRKIVFWGVGDYFEYCVKNNFPVELVENVIYVVDQKGDGSYINFFGKNIPLFLPQKLSQERNCVIIIAGSNFVYEIYNKLKEMKLGDDIECYAFPLILAVSEGAESEDIKAKIFNSEKNMKIPKIIHSFWFSGEKKPKEYQKCIDSWKRECPGYEVYEWNMNNYDYTKNLFMKQAIEAKKWAFASDVARLDVIFRMGGVYMDMDVELLKPLDCLLGNEGFFTFENQNNIDLAMFGAKSQNALVKMLLELYDKAEFSSDIKTMNWLCQPRYIRASLEQIGLKLNGNMQYIEGMAFLNRKYLSPKDSALYQFYAMSEESIAIHHFNTGWIDNFKDRRINDNGKLWDLVTENY